MFLYYIKDLTSNLDKKIYYVIFCNFSITRFVRLKGFMESEISILFYFCDNAKYSLVRAGRSHMKILQIDIKFAKD